MQIAFILIIESQLNHQVIISLYLEDFKVKLIPFENEYIMSTLNETKYSQISVGGANGNTRK
jgi:hypothetical protein